MPAARITPVESEADRRRGLGDFLATVALAGSGRPDAPEARDRLARIYDAPHAEWGPAEARALGATSGTAGGYLMPADLRAEIMAVVDRVAIVRPRATVLPMARDELPVPRFDRAHGGIALSWVATDGDTLAETDATLGAAVLRARTLGGTVEVSGPMMRSAAGIGAALAEAFGAAVAHFEDEAFLAGDGIARPLGITRAPGLLSSDARAAADAIAYADLLKPWGRMLPANRRRSAWLVGRAAEDELLGAASVPAGALTFAGAGDFTLLGRPGFTSEHLPALNTTGDVILADLSRYVIGDRLTLEIASSDHAAFGTGKAVFRLVHRVAGLPLGSAALTPDDAGATVAPLVALGTA